MAARRHSYEGTSTGAVSVTARGDGDCTWQFKDMDGQWLFYTYPDAGSNVVHLGCTRSRRMKDAGDDLLFITSLSASPKRNRLSGTVSILKDLGPDRFDNAQKLQGIHVTVSSDSVALTTTTNFGGVFELTDLKPGIYQVHASLPESDLIYMSFVVGKLAAIFDSKFGEQPGPLQIGANSGVEVNFVLVPKTLLKQGKSRSKRQ